MRLTLVELESLQHSAKSGRSYHRLRETATASHEFRGRFGHPSSYAYVRFECAPADSLVFQATCAWPLGVSPDYARSLEHYAAEGVADVLLTGLYAYSGCEVSLLDVRYDEIGSSEATFLWAATAAMRDLVARRNCWEIVSRLRG
jgi:hypothetical protein